MKIIKNVKNKLEYKKWRKISENMFYMMNKHINDDDTYLFRFYAKMNIVALTKMMELKSH